LKKKCKNLLQKVTETLSKGQQQILSNRFLKYGLPVFLWMAIIVFFYLRMLEKQNFYVISKARQMAQSYQNLIISKQTISDFIINYNEYLLSFKNEISKIHNGDSTKLNFNYLLFTPAYKQIEINHQTISIKPFEFQQIIFYSDLKDKEFQIPTYENVNSFELPSQEAFTVPLDIRHFQQDTITISYSLPNIVVELNRLYELEFFYLPANDVSQKFEVRPEIISASNHYYKKISPEQSTLITDQVNLAFKNKNHVNESFSQILNFNGYYFNVIFIPTFNLKKEFSGYIFTYSRDGYHVFYFREFLKRSLAATLSLIIIFFLFYQNFKNQKILKQQNLAILRDQEDLKKAKEMAEQANLIKSEFLANMSHEIRTPMNTVLGFTEILVSQITDEHHKKYLAAISAGTKNLLVLINDILDLSKIEAGKMKMLFEPADPCVIFKEIESIFSDKVKEKNLQFVVNIPDEMPKTLLIDEIRFRQILFNLIGNAIKFTENGYVKITAKVEPSSENREFIDLIIDVEDSGIGIEKENQEDIFNAFQQQDGKLNKKYGGSGLGLSISKKLAHLMNGSISISSKKEKGSTFTLKLRDIEVVESPLEKQNELPAKNSFGASNYSFHEATILIVDDVEQNRFLLKEFLRKSKLETFEAHNGKEAIEIAIKNKPNLILMDIRMPFMDGYEATKILKDNPETALITIIALTASVMEEEIKKIISRGFNHFLRKPIKYAELTEALALFLKHDIITAQNTIIESAPKLQISEDAREHIAEIIESLENSMSKKWERVKSGGFIDEIANFGIQIKDIGRHYAFESLILYGQKLLDSTDSFDVNNMNKTLNAFPNLIESVRNLAKNQEQNG